MSHMRNGSFNHYLSYCFSNMQELNIIRLSEDQIAQLLSAFWIQANLPDNLPLNFEAIALSFSLTVISSRLKVRAHQDAPVLCNIFLLDWHGWLDWLNQDSDLYRSSHSKIESFQPIKKKRHFFVTKILI